MQKRIKYSQLRLTGIPQGCTHLKLKIVPNSFHFTCEAITSIDPFLTTRLIIPEVSKIVETVLGTYDGKGNARKKKVFLPIKFPPPASSSFLI